MILDERNEFCDATALNTGAPALSYRLGDVIDTGGDGAEGTCLVIQMYADAASSGAATVQFHLCSDAQAAIATDGSATYHFSSAAIPVAALVLGYRFAVKLPRGPYERYLGILQTTGVAALTAGMVDAFLTDEANARRAFPAGL